MVKYICPKCGKRTMTEKEVEPDMIKFICSNCGFQYQKIPKDDKQRGFV